MQLKSLPTLAGIVIFSLLLQCVRGNDLARGFNDQIEWYKLDEGLGLAKQERKPIMALFHKSWCGACKQLKPSFATDLKIEKLSEKFVMINVYEDEDGDDRKYKPDGGYIPRILFMDPDGEVQKNIYNTDETAKKAYKFFYSRTPQIFEAMKTALEKIDTARKPHTEEM